MKTIIFFFFVIFSFNSYSVDRSAFEGTYPGFQSYQLITFTQLRNYFESLPAYSINFDAKNGKKVFKVRSRTENKFITIFSKITREISDKQIIERVGYYLEDGKCLEYELVKKGEKVLPSSDDDLLAFHFSPSAYDDFYQITIPAFNVQLTHSLNPNGVVDFFNMGFMEFNIKIESHFSQDEARLDYIYFYKEMRNPQSSLTVKAIKALNDWGGMKYYHVASNGGEITPGQFFTGLNEGAMVFVEGANIFIQIIRQLGFPKLN